MKPGYVYKSSAKKIAQTKLSHERHLAERRAYQKAYAAAHKEDLAAYHKEYERRPYRRERRREYNKAYTKAHGHAYNLRRKYGITAEQYDAMLSAQGGVCFLCGRPPKTRRLAVDHCHETGAVRKLLCDKCNRYVVFACERYPERVKRAQLYLAGRLRKPPPKPL